jgi:hypothetical protein
VFPGKNAQTATVAHQQSAFQSGEMAKERWQRGLELRGLLNHRFASQI